MIKIEKYIESNKDMFHYIGPVSETDIKDAERKLNVKFGSVYKTLVKLYGCISYKNYEFYGLGVDENSYLNVVSITQELRKNFDLPEDLIPILDYGDGCFIVTDSKNKIYAYVLKHNSDLKLIDEDMNKYLEKLFIE
jgi:hypothetical protein